MFTNNYPNLPGALFEFKDGGMALRRDITQSKTESVTILGTAVDGPVLEVVAIDEESLEAIYGKSVDNNGIANGSTLIKAAKTAFKRGCNDVRVMRVTGAVAKNTIGAEDIVSKEVNRVEENFAIISGNDETILTLSRDNIIQNSVKVYTAGAQLLTGFTVNVGTRQVTIKAKVTNAGVPVTIQYACEVIGEVENEAKTVADMAITLEHSPIDGTLSITKAGATVDEGNYTIAGKVVTFTTGVADADEIVANYSYLSDKTIEATDNAHDGVQFVTASSIVEKVVGNEIKKDSVALFVNGIMFTDKKAVTIDYVAKKVSVDKKYFNRGSVVNVEYLTETEVTTKTDLLFESYFGGAVYNQGSIEVINIENEGEVIGKKVIITKPQTKRNSSFEKPLEYSSLDYTTFNHLVEAINNDIKNGIYKVRTNTPNILVSELKLGQKFFVGGEDGVNLEPQKMFEALSGERNEDGYLIKKGAYQLLEDYTTDWVVPVGVFANEVLNSRFQNFAYELALFCNVVSERNNTTLGAISLKPCKDTSTAGVQEYAKKIAATQNLFFLRDQYGNIITDADNQPMDLGRFITVVAGPEIEEFEAGLGKYYSDPSVDYAALNAVLLPQSAPTNKTLLDAKKLKFNFSNAQLNGITGNRIVTFKTKIDRTGNQNIAVVDGVTSAHPAGDYTRVTSPKVVKYTSNSIREVCDPYIGEPNTLPRRNAMGAQISKRLSLLKEKGVIMDSAFQIISTPQDQLLGNVKVELTIVPPQELRKITIVMGLKPTL